MIHQRRFIAVTGGSLILAAVATSLAGCGSSSPASATTASSVPASPTGSATSSPTPAAAQSTTPAATPSPRPTPSTTSSAVYGQSANGRTVHAKVGDRFSISLGTNPRIVDNWLMQTPTKGLFVVSTFTDPTKAPRSSPIRGATSTITWVLQATGRGIHKLEATAFGKGYAGGVLTSFKMTVVVP